MYKSQKDFSQKTLTQAGSFHSLYSCKITHFFFRKNKTVFLNKGQDIVSKNLIKDGRVIIFGHHLDEFCNGTL